jgi:hypothetical protein
MRSTRSARWNDPDVPPPLKATLKAARRLAIRKQLLDSHALLRSASDKQAVCKVLEALRCVQIDPIRAVERTELLVLWSRLGNFDPALLNELLYTDKLFFENWAHCASICLMDDYPLFHHRMQAYAATSETDGSRTAEWVKKNGALLAQIREEFRTRGPLASQDITVDVPHVPWHSTGWTSGRSVPRMLDHLFFRGELMVAQRSGNRKVWHLTDEFLPPGTDRTPMTPAEVSRRSVQLALKALGTGTARDIKHHFMRHAYPDLETVLASLVAEKTILPVELVDAGNRAMPGSWMVHAEDAETLQYLEAYSNWEGRTVLLSPFDNLICDRRRNRPLFDFDFTIEIYVPVAERRYGYYVLPILAGDSVLGRVDTEMDRQRNELHFRALFLEEGREQDLYLADGLARTMQELGTFLGAKGVKLGRRMPVKWRQALRSVL